MPRNDTGTYSKPNTPVVTGTTISSVEYNATVDDLVADANSPRPIAHGGTGANSAETARTALEVARTQATTYDRTAGRGLIVGAFGLGGNAGEWTVADGLLSDIVPTSTRKVNAATAVAQGAPAAVNGTVYTERWDGTHATQVFSPVGGTTTWPWRRRQVAGTWSTWVRDFDIGSETTGRWERSGSGWQTCISPAVTFEYIATNRLGYTWTFPKAFAAQPFVSMVTSVDTADLTGLDFEDLGVFGRGVSATASTLRIYKNVGATNFGSGDKVENITLMAVGRWLDI